MNQTGQGWSLRQLPSVANEPFAMLSWVVRCWSDAGGCLELNNMPYLGPFYIFTMERRQRQKISWVWGSNQLNSTSNILRGWDLSDPMGRNTGDLCPARKRKDFFLRSLVHWCCSIELSVLVTTFCSPLCNMVAIEIWLVWLRKWTLNCIWFG